MKVVLLHDWLTGYRGGERVLEVFCEMFPEAPLYTLIYEKNTTSTTIENRKIVTSFLNRIPGVEKQYRKFLPFFPMAADLIKITEDADLVLSSSHCVIKGVKKPKNAVHISYIHSPMRYIYDQFDNYFGNAGLLVKTAAHLVRPYLKYWDCHSNANVDYFIANAEFVKKRIKEYYNKDAEVIHPFVDLKDFSIVKESPPEKEDFYLMVTAFAPNKRTDLAIMAFNELGLKLKIVGTGQEETKLKAMAKGNIEFLGNVSRGGVVSLMARAQAFIFPGVEDFGITPLEAIASGTPVIAYKIGGVLETMTEKTCLFFEEANKDSLIEAIRRYDLGSFNRKDLYERAESFSKEAFKEKISKLIKEKMSAL